MKRKYLRKQIIGTYRMPLDNLFHVLLYYCECEELDYEAIPKEKCNQTFERRSAAGADNLKQITKFPLIYFRTKIFAESDLEELLLSVRRSFSPFLSFMGSEGINSFN